MEVVSVPRHDRAGAGEAGGLVENGVPARLTDLAFDAGMYDPDTAAESLEIFGALMDNLVVQDASLVDEHRLALDHLEELGI